MQEEEKQNGSSGTPSEQPKKHKKEKGKSLIETMREIDAKEAQKEAEAEERRQEILAEREKKEKEAYAKKIQQDRIELMRLKQGIMEKKMHGKKIVFVSISCDKDKAAWEKMVKEQGLGGVQLHNGGDREFMTAFGIRGIPRFILLDKEGKIVNPNMTRPSNPETEKTLKALKGI